MVKAHQVRELGVYLGIWKYVWLRNQVFYDRGEYLVSFLAKLMNSVNTYLIAMEH